MFFLSTFIIVALKLVLKVENYNKNGRHFLIFVRKTKIVAFS